MIFLYFEYYTYTILCAADVLTQSSSKNKQMMKYLMANSVESGNNQRKTTVENLHLAECVGDVRSLLIEILCDELPAHSNEKGW